MSRGNKPCKTIFEPDEVNELLRGWLLHAHKGRERHDRAARAQVRTQMALGGSAVVLTAAVGTGTVSGLATSGSLAVRFAVGAAAVVAAVLVALQAFLDLPARAERHRPAGVRYKQLIRAVERMGVGTLPTDREVIDRVKGLCNDFDELEKDAPVVPLRIYRQVERDFECVQFVDEIPGLRRGPSRDRAV